MSFDARAAKQLAPGAHFTISDCPGLRLVASSAGHAWIYRYKSPETGGMRQVKIGSWPAMSYHAAVVQWEALRNQRETGADPAAQRKLARQAELQEREKKRKAAARRVTVATLCNQYLEEHVEPNRKEKGAKETRRLFATMLGDLADLEPHQVTRSHAFDLLQSHSGTPVVAQNLRRELGAAWDHALDAGRLGDNVPNWWRLVMRGKLRSRGRVRQGENVGTAKRTLSEAELAEVLRFLPNFSRLVEEVLTLYLWTLLRGSELLSMQGRQLTQEPDGLWWTIPKSLTKNIHRERATDHRVPLVGRAEVIVRRRWAIAGDGYLFPSRGRSGYVEQKVIGHAVWYHMPYSGVRPEQVRARLNVLHWAPHDLRRSCRTLLAKMGCPDEVGEILIGHLPPAMVGTYNLHTYDRERREWLFRLNAKLETLAQLSPLNNASV